MPGLRKFLFAIPASGLAVFLAAAIVSLFFSEGAEVSRILERLRSRELWYTVLLTLRYSLAALGYSWLGAWTILILSKGRGASIFRFFSILPGMAYALLVLSLLRTMGTEAPYSMDSVLMAWVLAGIPFLSSGISEGVRDLGFRSKEALQTLGAGPVRAFFHHDFRGTIRLQLSLLLQQFWFFLTSFSLVMILSGGPPFETLEVAIYSAVRLGRTDLSNALSLALVQALILAVVRIALVRLKIHGQTGRGVSEEYERARDPAGKLGTLVLSVICGAMLVILSARIPGRAEALSSFLAPLVLSLSLGAVVVFFTLVFSLSSYHSGLRALGSAGNWVSPILLSLSVWSFSGFRLPPFVNVALIQTVFFAPWVAHGIFPLLDRSQKTGVEAARVLGAGAFRAWLEVEWPRIKGAALRTAGLVFSLSVTEVSSVMLFSRGDFDTLSSYSQNLFSRFRIDEAAFGTVALLLISALSLHLAERRA